MVAESAFCYLWSMRSVLLSMALISCVSCARSQGAEAKSPLVGDEPAAQVVQETQDPEIPSDPKTYEVELASVVWSPFTDVPGRERIATKIVEAALRRGGVTMHAHTTEPGDVTRSIEAGKFDGSEAMWKSDDRQELFYFSEPYLENRLVLLSRKGSDVSATDLSQLKGKKVGLVEGYAYGTSIEQTPGVTFVRAADDAANLRALLEKKLDYMLVDELLVYHLFEYKRERAERLLSFGSHPLVLRGLHLALRKDVPGALEIIERFNGQIRDMIRTGEYHRLLNVNWLVADANGDGEHELLPSGAAVGTALPNNRYHLFGAKMGGTPRIMIEGEVYDDWDSVPDMHKTPRQQLPDFQPGLQAVLVEF